jgi:DNA gyrase subunit A
VRQEVDELSEEDLIACEDVIVTMTTRGYIKRIPASTYRPQRRGGKGIMGMVAREADEVNRLLVCNTHDTLLFFTTRGRAYQLKVHELPATGRQARGVPVNNLIALEPGEGVATVLVMPRNGLRAGYLILATRGGVVKRTALESFLNVRRNGLLAITIDVDDELAWVEAGLGAEDVLLVTSDGRAIRFAQDEVRSMGRTAAGVSGIKLRTGDRVVAMGLARPGHDLLVVTQKGIGKRTAVEEYPVQGRHGQGVATIKSVEKIGQIVSAGVVSPEMEMVLMSAGGQVIRQLVGSVPQMGRATQGVRLMGLNEGDTVVSLACLATQQTGTGTESPETGAAEGTDGIVLEPGEVVGLTGSTPTEGANDDAADTRPE